MQRKRRDEARRPTSACSDNDAIGRAEEASPTGAAAPQRVSEGAGSLAPGGRSRRVRTRWDTRGEGERGEEERDGEEGSRSERDGTQHGEGERDGSDRDRDKCRGDERSEDGRAEAARKVVPQHRADGRGPFLRRVGRPPPP